MSDNNLTSDNTNNVKIKSMIPNSKSRNNLFFNTTTSSSSSSSSPNKSSTILKSTSQYIIQQSNDDIYNEKYWSLMIPSAAYFHIYNSVLGDVFAMVYNDNLTNSSSNTLSTFIIAKHGCSVYPNIDISSNSLYYSAIENLNNEFKSSKVRKALAISLLKSFADLNEDMINTLYKQANLPINTFDWDETQAGLLASQMNLINTKSPIDVGSYLYDLGYLSQNLSTGSYVVDVIYNEDPNDNSLSEKNNALAFLLGKQLEQLFDPLSEYSPEPTEKAYKPPSDINEKLLNNINTNNNNNTTNDININIQIDEDSDLVKSICSELLSVQTNYTVQLVQFLQNFVIPLRIQVLENKLPGFTTTRLNQLFPPTIDEVTRINCIFLDMLKLAQPYGSYEILKACGKTIPYFYKAQMRHEAAIKNFHSDYLNFINEIKKINKLNLLTLDQRSIETAIYSSLNLVKIQLIIQRLYKNKIWPKELIEDVNLLKDSCDATISSFANDKLIPYNGRIFTPTGKILTEIAKGWPSELQNGWLTRRVVAVFDAIDVLNPKIQNNSVIIIFSDHVLFLSIDDDEYYYNLWNNKEKNLHQPSISDILMHSLTNETPLTKLPHMNVKSWCKINSLNALYYTSNIDSLFMTKIDSPNSYIRFFNENDPSFTGIYKLEKVSGKYVTEVIARSKILNKSQSFHLFCGSIDDENESGDNINNNKEEKISKKVYYTAHEFSTYIEEETKSPFIVLFNEKYDKELLNKYNVYAFITLNFISDDVVRLEGLSRCKFGVDEESNNEKFAYDIRIEILSKSLSIILTELFATHMSLYNPMMLDYLLFNNGKVNNNAKNILDVTNEKLDKEKERIIENINNKVKERKIINDIKNDKTNKRKSVELMKSEPMSKPKVKKVESKEKKKGIFSIFKSPKSKSKSKTKSKSNSKTQSKPITKPRVINLKDEPERKSSVLYKKVSIKRNKEIDYSALKPAKPKVTKPRLSLTIAEFTNKSEEKINKNDNTIKKEIKDLNDNTDEADVDVDIDVQKSNASTSIYVNSKFEFPMEPSSETFNNFKEPRYAPLKDSPRTKGYKDSIDLMGKFEDLGNYDDDLFELNEKPQLNKQVDEIKSIDLPTAELSVVNKEIKDEQIKTNRTIWRDITKPIIIEKPPAAKLLPSPIKPSNSNNIFGSISRSDSFYIRFRKLRKLQDESLHKRGISYISDLSSLKNSDQKALDSGMLFSIDETIDDNEETNWEVFDDEKQEKEKKNEKKKINESGSVSGSVIINLSSGKSSNRVLSKSSSVYLSSNEIMHNEFFDSLEFDDTINPYAIKEEDEHEREHDVFADLEISEDPTIDEVLVEEAFANIDTIPMYDDDDIINFSIDDKMGNIDFQFDEIEMNLINELENELENENEDENEVNNSIPSLNTDNDNEDEKIEDEKINLSMLSIDLSSFNMDTINESNIKQSDTIIGLNRLLNDKSYAYLKAIFRESPKLLRDYSYNAPIGKSLYYLSNYLNDEEITV